LIDTDARKPLPRFARVIGEIKHGYLTVPLGTIVKILRRDGYAKMHHRVFCEFTHKFTNYLGQERVETRQAPITVDKLKPLSILEQLAACVID
jgi:hypothetical protein